MWRKQKDFCHKELKSTIKQFTREDRKHSSATSQNQQWLIMPEVAQEICRRVRYRSDISHACRRFNILALCLLHWVHIMHIRYVVRFSLLMCWYLGHKHIVIKYYSGHFTHFHGSLKHWLYVHLCMLTLTCFIIDNRVNKDTPFLVLRCVQSSKYLYHFISVW